MSILSKFKETINSDNRIKYLDIDNSDEIIIGANSTQVFEFPFSYSSYVKYCSVIYKQGLHDVLEVYVTDDMVKECEDRTRSIITIELEPSQTMAFRKTILDTYCQVRIVTTDDKVLYDEPHYIKVLSPLY